MLPVRQNVMYVTQITFTDFVKICTNESKACAESNACWFPICS